MSSLDEIKISLTGIGEILRNHNLTVPLYQRAYAWKEQNVKELLDDIQNAQKEGAKEYFLGSIVISHKNESRPEISDGQQRLATASILLAAIRDYCYRNNENVRATDFENYLAVPDTITLERVPRLRLNQTDHDFFEHKILSLPDSVARSEEPTRESHERIAAAAQIAKNHVTNLASRSHEPGRSLAELVNFVRYNVKVIWVRVPDDANAFSIFETLNDRGLRLAISDLLKNYLFSLSGERIDEVQERWIGMTNLIETAEDEEMTVTFIRQLWSSMKGITRERELYSKIKEGIKDKSSGIRFANELRDSATLFIAILNPNHEYWNEYGPTAREHMRTLNELGMTQIRPLLLAILDQFSVAEVKKCLKFLVSWSVRFLIYGGLGGGALEQQYCIRAVDIRDGKIKTAVALFNAMRDVVPSDRQFHEAFEIATVSKDQLARYYLRVLENQAGGKAEPEYIPNSNEDVVNLEHILPEHPSLNWGNITPDDLKAYYKRIGNLALLAKKINSKIGNKGFVNKRPSYESSDFRLTKEVAQFKDWGIDEIKKRQLSMADLAIQAWPNKIV